MKQLHVQGLHPTSLMHTAIYFGTTFLFHFTTLTFCLTIINFQYKQLQFSTYTLGLKKMYVNQKTVYVEVL